MKDDRGSTVTRQYAVDANKGSHGVDGMSVKDLRRHIVQNWQAIRESIEIGTYEPSPVRRVEIPKQNGGTRLFAKSSLERVKAKIKTITSRSKAISTEMRIKELYSGFYCFGFEVGGYIE